MFKPRRSGRISFNNWVRKVSKEKALVHLVAVCLVLLILCVLLSIFHVSRIFGSFEQTSYDYIINRSDLTSKYFSDNFERRGSLVAAEAQVLAQDDSMDKTAICNCLKVLEETGEFTYAVYVSSRGIKYRSNGSLNSIILTSFNEVVDPTKEVSIYKNFSPEY